MAGFFCNDLLLINLLKGVKFIAEFSLSYVEVCPPDEVNESDFEDDSEEHKYLPASLTW